MKPPILIATLGFPGSGKTHFSERLAETEGFFHLNSDATRFAIFDTPTFSRPETVGVFRLMDRTAESLLKIGVSVVYDANMNFRVNRKGLEEIAARAGARYFLVWIKTEVELAEERLQTRHIREDGGTSDLYRPVDAEVLHRMKREMQEPLDDEPFISIDGHGPFADQVAELKRHIPDL